MQDLDSQDFVQVTSEICGFVIILAGFFLLHITKDAGDTPFHLNIYSSVDGDDSTELSDLDSGGSRKHLISQDGIKSRHQLEMQTLEDVRVS